MIHVAVVLQRYLDLILRGEKPVECRLTIQARDPFERIQSGERVYLKVSSGPYAAQAIVDHVLFEFDLTPHRISQLRRDYNHLIRGEASYWKAKRTARFCSLIWLRDVEPTTTGPHIRPLQGVAWLCLNEEPAWRRVEQTGSPSSVTSSSVSEPFAITITAGNIRNNTLYAKGLIDRVPARCIGGARRDEAGSPLTLVLHQGPTVQTDIVGPRKLVRSRVWGKWFEAHDAHPGDSVLFTPITTDTFHVGLIRQEAPRQRKRP